MNYEEKLNIVLSTIKEVYLLDDTYIQILKDNIDSRVSYYSDIVPTYINETTYINNSSTIGDFFINRLLNNIRYFEYNFKYNPLNNRDYKYEYQTLSLSAPNVLSEITTSKLKNRLNNLDDELLNKTYKKMMSYEIGRAFHISFSGKTGYSDQKHDILIKKLNEKNPNIFLIPNNEGNLEITHNGLLPILKNDEFQNTREYYSKLENISLLDDLFSEYEALVLNNTQVQDKYVMRDECYKNILNFESTNYKITSYAFEMSILLGKKKIFDLLYMDSISFYNFFDSFVHISESILKEKNDSTPTTNEILNHLINVKTNNSLKSAFILDMFFLKCLEQKFKHILQNNNSNDIKMLFMKELNNFKNETIKCDVANLEIDSLFDSIVKFLSK